MPLQLHTLTKHVLKGANKIKATSVPGSARARNKKPSRLIPATAVPVLERAYKFQAPNVCCSARVRGKRPSRLIPTKAVLQGRRQDPSAQRSSSRARRKK